MVGMILGSHALQSGNLHLLKTTYHAPKVTPGDFGGLGLTCDKHGKYANSIVLAVKTRIDTIPSNKLLSIIYVYSNSTPRLYWRQCTHQIIG